jgi:hypothetical protein
MTYERAFADHKYLWEEYGPAKDMTGGYVDSGDLELLLQSPTKATARRCLESQIRYWFDAGPDDCEPPAILRATDPKLREIADRYGASLWPR